MMKKAAKVKKRTKSRFLISIGECDGKPTVLNVNYVETIQQDGGNYVFTMKSGKVFSAAKSTVLDAWLKPYIIGHEVK